VGEDGKRQGFVGFLHFELHPFALYFLTTHRGIVTMSNMKAGLLIDRREIFLTGPSLKSRGGASPDPCVGRFTVSSIDGVCVLRYDNEAGKGDHRHDGNVESVIVFSNPRQRLKDFQNDVERWNDENGRV
jgi:hypothetical protein